MLSHLLVFLWSCTKIAIYAALGMAALVIAVTVFVDDPQDSPRVSQEDQDFTPTPRPYPKMTFTPPPTPPSRNIEDFESTPGIPDMRGSGGSEPWLPPPSHSEQVQAKRQEMQLSEAAGLGDKDPAELLTVIESPRWREWDSTRRRFDFLTRQFVQLCPDVSTRRKAADIVAFLHGKHREIGLDREEGLLALSNNLYGMTNGIAAITDLYGYARQECIGLWAIYMKLREGGLPAGLAKEEVTNVVVSLLNLGE